jgi:hypothetical protein
MAPHIYLVAANAFRRMLRERTSQSLIVNGATHGGDAWGAKSKSTCRLTHSGNWHRAFGSHHALMQALADSTP